MVLIGLLVLALACLVLGLVTAGAPWLVGSLVASAAAGYVLWKEREKLAASRGADKDDVAPKVTTASAAAKARPAAGPAGGSARVERSAAPTEPDPQQQVWVVDTMPQFHVQDCSAIQNLDAEAIALAQAIEDGFTECAVCSPAPSSAAKDTTGHVWVVDGRPDYHVDDCRSLQIAASQQSRDPEPIPHAQALEDGFSACPDCDPPSPADTGPADAAPGSVWVVDGRPRYHVPDCMIIKDQQAEEIPIAQAEEDGFMACSMCQPNLIRRA